jgi:DNA-binding transcriptional regulator LsrR (DeoR family)
MSRRPRHTRELLGNVARWYYLNDLSQAEIGKRLNPPKDQAAVARILKDAKARGVIKVDIDADFSIGGVDDEHLASLLRDEFDWRDPIVVDVDATIQPDEREDNLHIALANHTGMRARHTIESGDHIGISGGRAGVRLATVIGRNPPSRRNITVTPLSGRLWNGRLWEIGGLGNQFEQPLNADYSALLLAVGLYAGHAPGIRFSQISQPLFVRHRNEAEMIMKANCAFLPNGGWNWELDPPTKAFLGLGVVDPVSGHRMARHFGDQSDKEPPLTQLMKAMELAAKAGLPYLGDVANRLFATLPLPAVLAQMDSTRLNNHIRTYQNLQVELHAVNERSVVVEWNHLREIRSVLAIAGGKLKVNVLWTVAIAGLLNPKQRIISEIATDTATAKEILRAKRDFDHASVEVKDWYTRMTAELFSDPKRDRKSK